MTIHSLWILSTFYLEGFEVNISLALYPVYTSEMLYSYFRMEDERNLLFRIGGAILRVFRVLRKNVGWIVREVIHTKEALSSFFLVYISQMLQKFYS